MPHPSAAASLVGLALSREWKVETKFPRGATATGGAFSEAYLVKNNDGRQGFLKALDFSEAFDPNVDTIKTLGRLVSAYEHERDVLSLCATKRLSNVVVAIDHGEVQVPNFPQMNGRVFYLIFELAAGDIRSQVNKVSRLTGLWSLRALRDVCLGLSQVHRQMIAHQDMKPSNVLVFPERGFHVADFGRASIKGKSMPHDGYAVAGDRTYSPPELLYGYTHPDFGARRFGCDLYMLGNLASFMFAGVNVTASVIARMDPQFAPGKWSGSYDQVLPYLQEAFGKLLTEIRPQMEPVVATTVISLISELCNPDLSKRGHPRGMGRPEQHTLERYVSSLDLAYRRAEVALSPRKVA